MRLSSRLFVALFATLLVVAYARDAWADKVLVLPFVSTGNASAGDLEIARTVTRAALEALSHRLPNEREQLTAEMAIKGGLAQTSEQYRAAGRASSSDWSVVGHVAAGSGGYRLELEACQVDTGRVESLARDIDAAKDKEQIGEMLALLLRAEGIGNADIPWLKGAPSARPPDEKKAVETKRPVPSTPAGPPAVKHVYAEGHPWALGGGLGVFSAVKRAENASGSATSLHFDLAAAYALSAVRGLEFRAYVRGALAGPQSLSGELGARYMFPLAPSARLFLGPELSAGVFGTLGGERTTRLLLDGALVLSLGLGDRVAVELTGNGLLLPGGATSLLLAGGVARGLVRF